MKIDFHAHTHFSKDCLSDVRKVLQRAVEEGMGGIAITDHETVEGALLAREIAGQDGMPLLVIVGEEIRTPHGEIMGLFLKRTIGACSVSRALLEIRKQGGIASIPHPFDSMRGSALHPKWLSKKEVGQLHAIEVFNARAALPSMNQSALEFAAGHNLAQLGGSDAHTLGEIGAAYTIVNAKDEKGVRDAIFKRKTKVEGALSSPLVHLHSRYASLRKKMLGD
ncbi:PHP-associated [Candidatus Anstonella stagnisolia]|nr:PHP-associated [Candidatus Anstonella stagnisolia]